MVTRLDLLTKVDDELSRAAKARDFAIVTIYGLAGVGKTTMIRAYSHRAKDNGKFVFWLNAESRQTIVTAFLELARHIFYYYWHKYYSNQHEDPEKAKARLRAGLGLPDAEKLLQTKDFNSMEPNMVRSAVKAVKDWLLRGGNQWLLVYENVEGSFDLLEFLPLTRQGQIILITHERKQCPWSISEIPVSNWTEDEAVDLFIKHLGFDDSLSETDGSCILRNPVQ
jgi:Cdc6-like AAA superfamily ATPase